ncbi:STAS domain-containing protein [Kitasatospora sp. DSM 101779]|uniref:STAS domain-containing protein n=1 Tax=Kitasatospora sp. DSM 101779 TaxID=2853165 RepID=UPI0021DAB4D8|nr:STAS domain-containing protein [Kitasatospora sp. DSM 101779]MCU7826817.1 STAS domain-containing protein [Kitasatospora sp. DSM 101779]
MGTELRVTRRPAPPGVCRLALVGQADMETSDALAEALGGALGQEPAPELLSVDCAALDFCGSAGLNELLRARQSALAAGIAFRLASPSPQVVRLLEVTEADTVFDVEGPDPCRFEDTAC